MTVMSRGTSNTNERGSAAARRARKNYLLEVYAADVQLVQFTRLCRCYRCGVLLDYETMEVDRIKPGCEGGTYVRGNIRPACGDCNKITGAEAQARKRARRRHTNALAKARREQKKHDALWPPNYDEDPNW